MAKEKKNNVLIYAVIAIVVVVAVVVGVILATKKGGDGGNSGDSGNGTSGSIAADYKNVDVTIEAGDYDAMEALAKDIQNGEATGKVVKIEGVVSHPLSAYSVVVPNEDGTKKIGTQFVIEGDGEYPEDGDSIVITGKVIEASPMYFVIQTIPDLLAIQESDAE